MTTNSQAREEVEVGDGAGWLTANAHKFTTEINIPGDRWSQQSADKILANMRDSIKLCREAASRVGREPITIPQMYFNEAMAMLRGESLAEAMRDVLKTNERRKRKRMRRRALAAIALRHKMTEHLRGLGK